MCHVIYVNESCHKHLWIKSHIWMNHLMYINASCHVYESHTRWVMSSIRTSHANTSMCHVIIREESRHVHPWVMPHIEWVLLHIWMRHVMYMDESCHIQPCVKSYLWISIVAYTNEHEWVMSRTSMSHFIYSTHQFTYINAPCHKLRMMMSHTSMSNVTYRNVYMNETSHLHQRVWQSHVTYSNDIHEWVMSHTSMTHVIYISESRYIYTWVHTCEREGGGGCERSLTHHTYTYIRLHTGC